MIALALAAAIAAGGVAPPRAEPDFDVTQAEPALVIATPRRGGSLPSPECEQDGVFCLFWPHWFRADVVRPVYGVLPARVIYVTTYSHGDRLEPYDPEALRLMLLLSHDRDTVMPTYASASVWREDDGEYYLPVASPAWFDWLPCEAMRLREAVDPGRLPARMRYDAGESIVRGNPDGFVSRDDHLVPKYAISVRRLGEWLANRRPTASEFSCEQEASASAPDR